MELKFKELCPNCGKDIESERLKMGMPCQICLPTPSEKMKEGFLTKITLRNENLLEIEEIFQKVLGTKMWALQRFWAKRFLEGESFVLSAPTGTGKTTMQIILSLWACQRAKKRCLIILPTSLLAHQVSKKLVQFKEKLGLDLEVSFYHSLLTKKEKREQLSKMEKAKIIVTTNLSLMKRKEINSQIVDLVFVDDIDSFLKKSKSLMFVFQMLNLPRALKRVVLKLYKREIDTKEALKKIEKLKQKIELTAQVIVSGATPKGKRTKGILLLREIFGFSVGGRMDFGRKILDCYFFPKNSLPESIFEILKKLGGGGLVFVPADKGSDFAQSLEKFLKEKGAKVKAFLKPNKKYFEMFEKGELDCLIGMATRKSPLVRGIDLPQTIRYAVFAGVPKFSIKIDVEEFHPIKWLMLLNNISLAIKENYKREFDFLVLELTKIKNLDAEKLRAVREALRKKRELEGFLEYARKVGERAIDFFKKILKDEKVIQALKESETISFGEREGQYHFLVVDEIAYLQASGRTSRLYIGGLTKGLSVVVVDDEKAFNSLKKELGFLGEEIDWKDFEKINLDLEIEQINEDRKKVAQAKEGKLKIKEELSLKSLLFVVESPNKAKTIARYFGRPFRKRVENLLTFEVFLENSLAIITASKGHIVDLDLIEGLFGVEINEKIVPVYRPLNRCPKCAIEVENNTCPFCGRKNLISSRPTIEALRKIASLVDLVVIGTDPDAEGEKIAFDLYLLLRPFNQNIKRARFHEVTKREIRNSLKNLEDFDLKLVEAQITRRIQDRWIGFSISPILWKVFKRGNLSAGRVQTPVLGWIVERTKKLKEKKELIILSLKNGLKISFKDEIGTSEKIAKEGTVEILKVEKKIEEINPYPPFTTDTLISALSFALKIDAKEAMRIAQRLFESGLITYHRTSSTRVSSVGVALAREYIFSRFGKEFLKERKWEMEGAHECIRPTRGIDLEKLRGMLAAKIIKAVLNERELRAYDIIFKRFIASQMAPAKVEKVSIKILVAQKEKDFEFITKLIKEGFSKIFPLYVKEVPQIEAGKQKISLIETKIVPAFYPFTYSEIVSLMKERGIGRPSTYAKILEILKKRRYAKEVNKKLISTLLGIKVFEFLAKNYEKYLSEQLTRELEEKMDRIEEGKESAEKIIREFYQEIKEIIEKALKEGVKYNISF